MSTQSARPVLPPELDDLAGRLVLADDRRLIGLAGPPGVGKSTIADALVERIGRTAIVVPMDGFHLPDAHLRETGRREAKGAPDTFDAPGFIDLLERLRASASDGSTVLAPRFDRQIEDPVADAIEVRPEHRIVVVEGNYLLLGGEWARVRELLDETIALRLDSSVRIERLIRRRMGFGEARDDATAWVMGSDEANARLVEDASSRADRIIDVG